MDEGDMILVTADEIIEAYWEVVEAGESTPSLKIALREVKIEREDLPCVVLIGAAIDVQFVEMDFRGSDLSRLRMSGCVFRGCHLGGVQLPAEGGYSLVGCETEMPFIKAVTQVGENNTRA